LVAFHVTHRVGRLIETRVSSLSTAEDVAAFGARFRQVAAEVSDEHIVICGDYRATRILAPEVAAKFVGMLTAANARVERSAILCSPAHATALLQIERTVSEANNASRRTFREIQELEAWLSEILTPPEQARVNEFLNLE
jgi:hypothetical protein